MAFSACALSPLSLSGGAVADELCQLLLRDGDDAGAETTLGLTQSATDTSAKDVSNTATFATETSSATCVECQDRMIPSLDFGDENEPDVDDSAVDAAEFPAWACAYCNVRTPAAVVKCVATGKWFCNSKPPGLPASCIVYHLVRSKHNEVTHEKWPWHA